PRVRRAHLEDRPGLAEASVARPPSGPRGRWRRGPDGTYARASVAVRKVSTDALRDTGNKGVIAMRNCLASLLRKTAVVFALPLFVCSALAGSGRTAASAADLIATRANSIGPIELAGISIKNFGVVDGRIFRGAQPKEKDYAALARIGVTT